MVVLPSSLESVFPDSCLRHQNLEQLWSLPRYFLVKTEATLFFSTKQDDAHIFLGHQNGNRQKIILGLVPQLTMQNRITKMIWSAAAKLTFLKMNSLTRNCFGILCFLFTCCFQLEVCAEKQQCQLVSRTAFLHPEDSKAPHISELQLRKNIQVRIFCVYVERYLDEHQLMLVHCLVP